jgi:hypothetical protein
LNVILLVRGIYVGRREERGIEKEREREEMKIARN